MVRARAGVMEPVRTEQRRVHKAFQTKRTKLEADRLDSDREGVELQTPQGSFLKCIAVSGSYQNKGLCGPGNLGRTVLDTDRRHFYCRIPRAAVWMWLCITVGGRGQNTQCLPSFGRKTCVFICLSLNGRGLVLRKDARKCWCEESVPQE